jgi:hypothetical protein
MNSIIWRIYMCELPIYYHHQVYQDAWFVYQQDKHQGHHKYQAMAMVISVYRYDTTYSE